MLLDQYQKLAQETDLTVAKHSEDKQDSFMIPLLGLAGEVGELLTEYKKQMRDGKAHTLYKERVREELGDILWYLANCATKYHLSLDDIASANLLKTRNRWKTGQEELAFTSGSALPHEAFPFQFEAKLVEEVGDKSVTSRLLLDGVQIGATLTDNAYDPDGYRFHDVFHLSYAAVLGWSPVIRALLKRKRRSNPKLDEVEDGGRAVVIEEGIAALVFAYARNHAWLQDVENVDYELIRTIKSMTAHLEVSRATAAQWEAAIFLGFKVWRRVVRNGGGTVRIDTVKRTMELA